MKCDTVKACQSLAQPIFVGTKYLHVNSPLHYILQMLDWAHKWILRPHHSSGVFKILCKPILGILDLMIGWIILLNNSFCLGTWKRWMSANDHYTV